MSDTGGWIWYELLTSDVEAAHAFYGSVVGWTPMPHAAVPGYFLFAAGGTTIGGLMAMPREAGITRPVWLGYVHVADVDATVTAAQGDGAQLCVPPTSIPGVGRFAMLLDPQGAAVYAMAPEQGSSESFADKVGHCQWNELVTTDAVAAVDFYVKHFGWQKGDAMSMGPLGLYQFLVGGGQRFGAAMKRSLGARPIWRYYFGVDDIDRATRAIQSGGGKLLNTPDKVPSGNYAVAAVDPQGAEFGIAGPRQG
jgi:predicted enzyme related to lactoylglutathione lyase